MFSYFGSASSFFIMPVCYHPTTIMLVDDDAIFLKFLSNSLNKYNKKFTSVNDALDFINNNYKLSMFTQRCLKNFGKKLTLDFNKLSNEMYNAKRFNEIIISVIDYDMPDKNGIDLINTMQFPPEIQSHSFIMLTGQIDSPQDTRIAGRTIANSIINKSDSECIKKLEDLIDKKCANIFQWASYIPIQILANDPNEKTTFLFDKNSAHLIDEYIARNNICELYLFDRQGSYTFLDADGKLSWFIIRNELGIENNIILAKHLKAPKNIISAIENREYILSFYTGNEITTSNLIDWDKYLLKAKKFTTSKEYIERFDCPPNLTYYYAFTNDIPNNNINRQNIFTYNDFLSTHP